MVSMKQLYDYAAIIRATHHIHSIPEAEIQGKAMLFLGQSRPNCQVAKNLEEVVFIPSCFEAFVLNADLGGCFLFECDMS